MNEKEELEFHEVWDALCDEGYRTAYEAARKCWVESKRRQPVVELPMPDRNDHTDVAFYIQKLRESLADAGIQYRMKGE